MKPIHDDSDQNAREGRTQPEERPSPDEPQTGHYTGGPGCPICRASRKEEPPGMTEEQRKLVEEMSRIGDRIRRRAARSIGLNPPPRVAEARTPEKKRTSSRFNQGINIMGNAHNWVVKDRTEAFVPAIARDADTAFRQSAGNV